MREITIERMKRFTGSSLLLQIQIDQKTVATLRNGKSVTIDDVSGGPHTIQCIYEGPGALGGTKKIISDIINIPKDDIDYHLLVTFRMSSIKFEKV